MNFKCCVTFNFFFFCFIISEKPHQKVFVFISSNASLLRDISVTPIWCDPLCSFFPSQELFVKAKDLINNLTKLAVEPEEGGKARLTDGLIDGSITFFYV